MVDWSAFDRALRARRRQILERFVACLRVDTVSQQPALYQGIRTTARLLVELGD